MLAQLIYLHIEKSAGTSQRALLYNNYGKANVFWHGLNSNVSENINYSGIDNVHVIGGHINYTAFSHNPHRLLFSSVVREPVSRAVSLFHYHINHPEQEHRIIWYKQGLDPANFIKSVEKCKAFRNSISNSQCVRLSGKPNFEEVMKTITRENFVIGFFDNLERFNRTLATILHWKNYSLSKHNVGRPNYQEGILQELGVIDIIRELNLEDEKLYNFIKQEGGYTHVPDLKIFQKYLIPEIDEQRILFSTDDIKSITISLCSQVNQPLVLSRSTRIPIKIKNNSLQALEAKGSSRIMLGCRWFSTHGEFLEYEGGRAWLPANLFPGEECIVEITAYRPPDLKSGEYDLRFSLLQVGVCWLESLCSSHAISIRTRVE